MDLDICPIIPDESNNRKEPYNQALTKLLRANDHKIIDSYVKFNGSSAYIEIVIKCDQELMDRFQEMKELKIKE